MCLPLARGTTLRLYWHKNNSETLHFSIYNEGQMSECKS